VVQVSHRQREILPSHRRDELKRLGGPFSIGGLAGHFPSLFDAWGSTPIIGVGVHRGNAPNSPTDQGYQDFRRLRVKRRGGSACQTIAVCEYCHDKARSLHKGRCYRSMGHIPLMSLSWGFTIPIKWYPAGACNGLLWPLGTMAGSPPLRPIGRSYFVWWQASANGRGRLQNHCSGEGMSMPPRGVYSSAEVN
jgi:hypothetical protein